MNSYFFFRRFLPRALAGVATVLLLAALIGLSIYFSSAPPAEFRYQNI
tara:strand:- start:10174 stop:10317 length:144 start_codon:yes stop_codon:yes gene_type:complete